MRVYILAKKLGVESTAIIKKSQDEGLDIKNHMSLVSADTADIISSWFKEINTIAELLEYLKAKCPSNKLFWFRGHGDKKWKLVPHLMRPGKKLDHEIPLMKTFQQNALTFLPNKPEHEWEWMFLMQHYGIPTRLLDWTESPLVALYFVVSNAERWDEDGAFFILSPDLLNKITSTEQRHPRDIPCFGHDKLLKAYNPSEVSDFSATLKPVAAIAPRSFERLRAQLSVFTIFHRDPTPIEELPPGQHIQKCIIPAESKENILKELDYLTIDNFALFPELGSAAEKSKKGIIS